MSDTARVLLTAALLSATALAAYVWRLTRLESTGPGRLIGALRIAQSSALALAATGAASIGLAVANESAPFSAVEVTIGIAFVLLAALVLRREPREALWLAAGGLVLHALLDIGHRPGGLPTVAPHWYAAGCAVFNVCVAIVCYRATRR